MDTLQSITIIANPGSTSDSVEKAKVFQAKLARRLTLPLEIRLTERPGHAEQIAGEIAKRPGKHMVISSSGDGGYNEVVNGVLKSGSRTTILGLLPGGNANDHYAHMHRAWPVKRIIEGQVDEIDALRVTSSGGLDRYAHSYIGLGMTAELNELLSQYDFHPLREVGVVLKNILHTKPVKVIIGGRTKTYSNIVFFNSGRMSKFVKTGPDASIADGKFDLMLVEDDSVGQLAGRVVKAATFGMDDVPTKQRFTFTCEHDTSMQIDGEKFNLKKGEKVTVVCLHKKINCII